LTPKRLAKIINEINNILLPRVCFGCNTQLFRGERILCTVCRHDVPLTDHNYLEENAVDRIVYGRTPIKKAASFVFFSKNGLIKSLLHWLKYKNQEQIGGFFGDWCGAYLKENGQLKNIDVVVPVPLHPKKQKKRGYNQVALFAQKIANNIGATYCDDWLIKVKNIKTQTKKAVNGDGKVPRMPLNLMHQTNGILSTCSWWTMLSLPEQPLSRVHKHFSGIKI